MSNDISNKTVTGTAQICEYHHHFYTKSGRHLYGLCGAQGPVIVISNGALCREKSQLG